MLRSTRLRAAEASNEEVKALEKENDRLRAMASPAFCAAHNLPHPPTAAATAAPSCPAHPAPPSLPSTQLAERAADGATKSGYLNKYRPHATSSLWANTWEVRYVILRGATLCYFRSERDVAYPPRGEIHLTDTYVDAEGLKRRKFWTFRVVDRQGVDLVRLSTEVYSEYTAWLDALERAGCTKRAEEDSRALSPGPSQTSPGTSAISDSDTATSGRPGRGRGDGDQEVDSTASYGDRLRRQPSGYTSDQSDVGRRVRPASRRTGRSGGNDTSVPVHTQPRFSLLSSERIQVSNQSGLLTLVFIVLAAANFRLILENIIKYGLRFNPLTFLQDALTPTGNVALLLCWPALAAFAGVALGIEQMAARFLVGELKVRSALSMGGWVRALHALQSETEGAAAALGPPLLASSFYHALTPHLCPCSPYSSTHTQARTGRDKKDLPASKRAALRARLAENFIFVLNAANTTAALLVPFGVIYDTEAEPLPAFVLTMATCVMWLKLVSFAHVNWSLRRLKRRDPGRRHPGESGSGTEPAGVEIDNMVYPANLTASNLGYFLAAPTLCYQLSYPRSPRFRLRWVLRRICMMCASLALMLFIMEQYIEPTIDNSLKPLQEMVSCVAM